MPRKADVDPQMLVLSTYFNDEYFLRLRLLEHGFEARSAESEFPGCQGGFSVYAKPGHKTLHIRTENQYGFVQAVPNVIVRSVQIQRALQCPAAWTFDDAYLAFAGEDVRNSALPLEPMLFHSVLPKVPPIPSLSTTFGLRAILFPRAPVHESVSETLRGESRMADIHVIPLTRPELGSIKASADQIMADFDTDGEPRPFTYEDFKDALPSALRPEGVRSAMARIFITGSSDGLGRMAARLLVEEGHEVVLHARDAARGRTALDAVPGATAVLTGDLASIAQTRQLAEAANATGTFDAVIHNAAVGFRERRRIVTEDGLSHVFAVNTLAPYLLTALVRRPKRLVYVSSELHRRGDASSPGPHVGAPPVAGQPGLLRHQAARRAAGLRRGPPLAGHLVQRAGAGLGGDEDGRPAGDGRPGRRAPDPGLARRER